ncbi:hypothetical protein Leryth_007151 [Lithospermum erythrorhizon]|nr:hypothetical protein Leryth_007151 [Lithospermum erythrorhizon]
MDKKDKEKIEPKKLIKCNKYGRTNRRATFMEKAKKLFDIGDQIAYINFTCDGELHHYIPDMSGLLARYHEFESQSNLAVPKHQNEQEEDQAPKQSNESTSSRQLLAGDIGDVGSEKEFQIKRELNNAPSSLQANEGQMLKHLLAISEIKQKELMLENERLTKQVEDLKSSFYTKEHTQPQHFPVAEDITEKQGTSSNNRVDNEVNLDLMLGSTS